MQLLTIDRSSPTNQRIYLMNDKPDNIPQPVPPMEDPDAVTVRHMCGNCAYGVPIPKNLQQVECRWGPPHASMVAMPSAPGKVVLQQVIAFPNVPRTMLCAQHKRRTPPIVQQ
jgi:hypothetical protein